jgi:hypothetical protein
MGAAKRFASNQHRAPSWQQQLAGGLLRAASTYPLPAVAKRVAKTTISTFFIEDSSGLALFVTCLPPSSSMNVLAKAQIKHEKIPLWGY